MLIARHGDRGRSWDEAFDQLIEAARQQGEVDDAAWARYARQSVDPRLYARPVILAGYPLPWGFGPTNRRGGGAFYFDSHIETARIGSLDLLALTPDGGWIEDSGGEGDPAVPPDDPVLCWDAGGLPVGRQTLSAAVTFSMSVQGPGSPDDRVTVVQWRQTWELPVEVVPADAVEVRPVAAPALAAAFDANARGRVYLEGPFKRDAGLKGPWLHIKLEVDPLPANLPATVFVQDRATGRKWDCGVTVLHRGRLEWYTGTADLTAVPPSDRPAVGDAVDILLVPDPDPARGTIGVFDYPTQSLRLGPLLIGGGKAAG